MRAPAQRGAETGRLTAERARNGIHTCEVPPLHLLGVSDVLAWRAAPRQFLKRRSNLAMGTFDRLPTLPHSQRSCQLGLISFLAGPHLTQGPIPSYGIH